MRLRSSPLFWLVGFTVLVAAGWYVVMPRRAFGTFLHGVATNDVAAVDRSVDFPALRANFSRDFGAVLSRGGQRDPAHTAALVSMLVDSMATPQGLEQLVASFSADPSGAAGSDDGPGLVPTTHYAYRSPVRVDVSIHPLGVPPDQAGIYTFTLHGMRWELTRIWSERMARLTQGS